MGKALLAAVKSPSWTTVGAAHSDFVLWALPWSTIWFCLVRVLLSARRRAASLKLADPPYQLPPLDCPDECMHEFARVGTA
mmetsp:Transcript_46081/g.117007  ORF Transcript_46081/g.117007 Transcript_46081/m.117007 type:complete len:81 (-) Transcript_46081:100-342(-)